MKKLQLRKETLRTLTSRDLGRVAAGGSEWSHNSDDSIPVHYQDPIIVTSSC